MAGLFVTFEGGEGTGKSLQSNLLVEHLIADGKEAILTREPGGTALSEDIRALLVNGSPEKIDPITESLLYLAARANHWIHRIKPMLDADKIVVCDRFQDSTLVYQGIGKVVNKELLNSIFNEFTNGREPDRTYLLDMDSEIGISRSLRNGQNTEARYEKMDINYHKTVREGFLALAHQAPGRFCIIDGMQSESDIHQLIMQDLKKFL